MENFLQFILAPVVTYIAIYFAIKASKKHLLLVGMLVLIHMFGLHMYISQYTDVFSEILNKDVNPNLIPITFLMMISGGTAFYQAEFRS